MKGTVIAVCTSREKGTSKENVDEGVLVVDHGLEGDSHAGGWHRQVSLLGSESITGMRDRGLDVGPGSFGENLTTEGVRLHELPVGARLKVGECLLEVTQIGKVCHSPCEIFHTVGSCIMPSEGVFARVLEGGLIKKGDAIEVIGK